MTKQKITIALVGVVGICILLSWFISTQEQKITKQIQTQLANDISYIKKIAATDSTVLARTLTEGIVNDCQNRAEYEDAMVRLNTLSGDSLDNALYLHQSCGNYRPTARAIKVLELQSTLASIDRNLELMLVLKNKSDISFRRETWLLILDKELEITELLNQQNRLQNEIIIAMQNNETATINSKVEEAQSINELLKVSSMQLSTELKQLFE